jgi:rod shape-determining protein MreB
VTQKEAREALNEPIQAIIEAIKTALERTPTEFAADIVHLSNNLTIF